MIETRKRFAAEETGHDPAGLVSQASIAQGGAWLPAPDSREW